MDADLLTYASVTRGFKGGGFDNRATASIYAEKPFEPENVLAYEAGVKSEAFERRLRTNISVFYNDYSNMQTSVVVPGTTVSLRQNADSAHTTGVEYEGAVLPLAGLQIGANLAYLFSTFDRFPNAAGGSATGKALPFAPRWMAGGSLSYDLPLGIPGTARLTIDGRYQSTSNAVVLNLWQTQIPVQVSVNAAASYATEDGRWTGTLAAHNLFDRANVESVSYSGAPVNSWQEIVAPPRTVTFTLRYSL